MDPKQQTLDLRYDQVGWLPYHLVKNYRLYFGNGPILEPSNSPVPRLSFATRFDTKLREKSFEKQYSAKAVLFTMYVPTVGICTQICPRTWAHYNEISHASAQVKTAFTEFWVKTKIFLRAEKYF